VKNTADDGNSFLRSLALLSASDSYYRMLRHITADAETTLHCAEYTVTKSIGIQWAVTL